MTARLRKLLTDLGGLAADTGKGISVVADQGNPDPAVQGRFPVRFDIADTTTQQEAALLNCLNVNSERYRVRGYLPENDGN